MSYYDPNAQPDQRWQAPQPGQPWPPQQPMQPPYTQPYAPPGQWQQPGQPWPPMQPPPPKKKRHVWLWVIGGIVALMFFSVVSHATQSSTAATQTTTDTISAQATTAPTPTPTPDPSQNPAYQMAGIDNGTATPDDATVVKYQRLLDDLHKKTGDSELDIANETVAGQQILAKRGQSISLYDLANAVNKGIPPGTPKMPYAQSLAAITTLMSSNNQ